MAKPHWLEIAYPQSATLPTRPRAICSEAATTEQAERITTSLLGRYRSAMLAAVLLPTGEYYVKPSREYPQIMLEGIALTTGGEYSPDLNVLILPRPDHTTPLAIYYGVQP